MNRVLWLTMTTLLAGPAFAAEPLTTDSEVMLGISEKSKAFVTVEEDTRGTVTRFRPVYFASPKWREKRVRGAPEYRIDIKDDETKVKTEQKAAMRKQAVDDAFAKMEAQQTHTVAGSFTGRVRLMDLGAVVYLEDGKLLVRVGDASVMKKDVIVKDTRRMVRGCRGTIETKVLRVAERADWKVVAALLETTCTVEGEAQPERRVKQLFVKDVSKLVD